MFLWLNSGTPKKSHFVSVHSTNITDAQRASLLAFHALTGSDSTSQFAGIVKCSAKTTSFSNSDVASSSGWAKQLRICLQPVMLWISTSDGHVSRHLYGEGLWNLIQGCRWQHADVIHLVQLDVADAHRADWDAQKHVQDAKTFAEIHSLFKCNRHKWHVPLKVKVSAVKNLAWLMENPLHVWKTLQQ